MLPFVSGVEEGRGNACFTVEQQRNGSFHFDLSHGGNVLFHSSVSRECNGSSYFKAGLRRRGGDDGCSRWISWPWCILFIASLPGNTYICLPFTGSSGNLAKQVLLGPDKHTKGWPSFHATPPPPYFYFRHSRVLETH